MNSKFGLIKHYKQDFGGLSIAIFLGILVNVMSTLTPLVPQLLIDRVINPALGNGISYNQNLLNIFIDSIQPNDYWGLFWVLFVVFVVIIFIKLVANYSRWQIANYFAMRGESRLRRQVFEQMLSQNSAVISKYTSGKILSICNTDITTMQQFYANQIMYISGVIIFFSFSVYIVFTMNPILIIVPIVGGVCTFVVAIIFAKISKPQLVEIGQARMDLSTTVQENIQGVRVVRSYATEDIEQVKFDYANNNLRNKFVGRANVRARFHVIFNTISQAIFFGSMIIGVLLAVDGKLSAGQLATLFVYTALIAEPFGTLADILNELQNTLIASNRVFGFMNTPNNIVDGANPPLNIDANRPHIILKGVRVESDDKTLVHDIDLDLPYGKRLGIMGKTGSGKTVLIKSLMRFYDCVEGSIVCNGVDIKEYKVEDVRKLYGYVMQDLFLFSESVYNNIAFYDTNAGLERVQQAAKISQAHDFVSSLSDGYDTIIGEKGVGLSGGQKQRVSMARAFLKNAPILLFDDCTSALDMDTERQVMDNIDKNFGKNTMIISTHRASSVKNCDEIIFLEQGRIVERGTHEQLMQARGVYYNIFIAQQAMQEEIMVG
ncbi:MAG: ABC transporter ATP-binding protein/permease [Firmicutes bacterium]|nr:ABC transporter ATP-binding protein/permease [Bacillota bacterium]MCL1953942.1 ABC transporter ATP-binding protein/permease [Bacillota bacterium]